MRSLRHVCLVSLLLGWIHFSAFAGDAVTLEKRHDLKVSDNGVVWTVENIDPGSTVVAGDFSSIDYVPRRNLALISSKDRVVKNWDPNPNGTVYAVSVDGPWLYVGGAFSRIGGKAIPSLARIDLKTGFVDDTWIPRLNGEVYSILIHDGELYAGGAFTKVGDRKQSALARFPLEGHGEADETWHPEADNGVYALAQAGDFLYIGGWFQKVCSQPRNHLAKISLAKEGALDPEWDPDADRMVMALAAAPRHLYVGGAFTSLGGLSISSLARVSYDGKGMVDPNFKPAVKGIISYIQLHPDQDDIFVCGRFPDVSTPDNQAAMRIDSHGEKVQDAALAAQPAPPLMAVLHRTRIEQNGLVAADGTFIQQKDEEQSEPLIAGDKSASWAGHPSLTSGRDDLHGSDKNVWDKSPLLALDDSEIIRPDPPAKPTSLAPGMEVAWMGNTPTEAVSLPDAPAPKAPVPAAPVLDEAPAQKSENAPNDIPIASAPEAPVDNSSEIRQALQIDTKDILPHPIVLAHSTAPRPSPFTPEEFHSSTETAPSPSSNITQPITVAKVEPPPAHNVSEAKQQEPIVAASEGSYATHTRVTRTILPGASEGWKPEAEGTIIPRIPNFLAEAVKQALPVTSAEVAATSSGLLAKVQVVSASQDEAIPFVQIPPQKFDKAASVATERQKAAYLNWIQQYSRGRTLGDETQPWADPDRSGMPNIVKYAIGVDPFQGASVGWPSSYVVHDPRDRQDYVEIQFRQRKGGYGQIGWNYQAAGFVFRVEAQENSSWVVDPKLIEIVGKPIDNGDGTETVTMRSTRPGKTQALRLSLIPVAPIVLAER